MTEKLPEKYKSPMEDTLQKHLEYQFHSATYHTFLQIITGLKTVLGHLVKVSGMYNFVAHVCMGSCCKCKLFRGNQLDAVNESHHSIKFTLFKCCDNDS